MLKCTLAGSASLCQQYLPDDPYDLGLENYFRDVNFRKICSDESYINGNTASEIQSLIAAIDGYVNLPLYKFKQTLGLCMVVESFTGVFRNLTGLISSFSESDQSLAMSTLNKQMRKLESATMQSEKAAIIDETSNAIKCIQKSGNITEALSQTADELDNIVWRGTKVVDGEIIIENIGEFGEHIAKDMLEKNGWSNFHYIKNASDNGIDIIAQAPDGHWSFFEVKSSTIGSIKDLTMRQANMDAFVNDILYQAKEGIGRYTNLDPAERDFAKFIYDEYKNNWYNISGNVIGVDIKNKIIKVSRWDWW